MATAEGYIEVYESSDGGSGNPCRTFWQFFVGKQPVVTENPQIAETIRLAISTSSKVRVTYDDQKQNTISQVRIEFKYVCESSTITPCVPDPAEPSKVICETRRFAPCDPKDIPDSHKPPAQTVPAPRRRRGGDS